MEKIIYTFAELKELTKKQLLEICENLNLTARKSWKNSEIIAVIEKEQTTIPKPDDQDDEPDKEPEDKGLNGFIQVSDKKDLKRLAKEEFQGVMQIPIHCLKITHDETDGRIEDSIKEYGEMNEAKTFADFDEIIIRKDFAVLKGNRTLDFLKKKFESLAANSQPKFASVLARFSFDLHKQQILALTTNNGKTGNLRSFLALCLKFNQLEKIGMTKKNLRRVGFMYYALDKLRTYEIEEDTVRSENGFLELWNENPDCIIEGVKTSFRSEVYNNTPPIAPSTIDGLISRKGKTKISDADIIQDLTEEQQQELLEELTKDSTADNFKYLLKEFFNNDDEEDQDDEPGDEDQDDDEPSDAGGEKVEINDPDEDDDYDPDVEIKDRTGDLSTVNPDKLQSDKSLNQIAQGESNGESDFKQMFSEMLLTVIALAHVSGTYGVILNDCGKQSESLAKNIKTLLKTNEALTKFKESEREHIMKARSPKTIIERFLECFFLKLTDLQLEYTE